MSNASVTSLPAEVVPARDEQLARVEISLLGTILALALLGNGMMAGVLRRISLRRKLTRMNRMMAHLTAADIFVAFCHVLPQVPSTSLMLFHLTQSRVIFSGIWWTVAYPEGTTRTREGGAGPRPKTRGTNILESFQNI